MRKGRPENNKMTSITSDEKKKSQQIPTAHFALLLTRVDCRLSTFLWDSSPKSSVIIYLLTCRTKPV